MRQPRGIVAGVCALMMLCVGSVSAANPGSSSCQSVQGSIDGLARTLESASALYRLAPYMSAGSVPTLLARAQSEPQRRLALLVSVGLVQDVTALAALRRLPRPPSFEDRVAHAVALLAVGDGSQTGTVTEGLEHGRPELRRGVARALARMRAVRPRRILYNVLRDPDEEARFIAAKSLSSWSTRAQRALIDLTRDGSPRFRTRAARILDLRQYRFNNLGALPDPIRGRAMVRDASKRRGPSTREIERMLTSSSVESYAPAMLSLAVASWSAPRALRRTLERTQKKQAVSLTPELAIVLALMGDRSELGTLAELPPDEAERAAAVLFSYAGLGPRSVSVSADDALEVARVVEAWLVAGRLAERSASRALRGLEVIDPEAAMMVARGRLLGPDGWSLRTSARILARAGVPTDLDGLLAAAGRTASARTKAELLRAAHRVCSR